MPPRPCSSGDTLTSSVIKRGRICSQSSLEALVRLFLDNFQSSVSLCGSNQCGPTHLVSSHHLGPRQTSQDWQGIRPPVDAAMVGKVFLGPRPISPPAKRRNNRRRKPSRRRAQRRRQSRFIYFYDLWDDDDWSDDYSPGVTAMQQPQSTPVQKVYFFMKGMDKELHCPKQNCSFTTREFNKMFVCLFVFFP